MLTKKGKKRKGGVHSGGFTKCDGEGVRTLRVVDGALVTSENVALHADAVVIRVEGLYLGRLRRIVLKRNLILSFRVVASGPQLPANAPCEPLFDLKISEKMKKEVR